MPRLDCGCLTTERGRLADVNPNCPTHGTQKATAPIGVGCSGCAHQAGEIRRLTAELADRDRVIGGLHQQCVRLAKLVDRLEGMVPL